MLYERRLTNAQSNQNKNSTRQTKHDSDKRPPHKAKPEIAYQNKDITSKFLAENFQGKTFRVYGLALPEIKSVLPTNIPAVKANETAGFYR